MEFSKWFNVYDAKHIEAFKYLQTNGAWPQYFLDQKSKEEITMDFNWYMSIKTKMSEAWMQYVCNKESSEG